MEFAKSILNYPGGGKYQSYFQKEKEVNHDLHQLHKSIRSISLGIKVHIDGFIHFRSLEIVFLG